MPNVDAPRPNAPAAPVVFCLDDNLVLASETLGRLWAPHPEAWPAFARPVNDNRFFRPAAGQR